MDRLATEPCGDVLLTVEGLTIVLDPGDVLVDEDISLFIRTGEVLGLVGESASGKTTAATCLLAHQRRGARISEGHILIDNKDLLRLDVSELRAVRGGLISYVPQDCSAALNPALRIGTQLREVLEAHNYGASHADRRKRLDEMMSDVLLPSDDVFLRRYPHQLSGGQQQRVVIAMAIANRPKLIVLDEPTTALDVTTQAHVLATVRELSASYRAAILYVTHDLAVVANLVDRIAVMYGGRVVELGRKRDIFESSRHPYTRRLLASIPDIAGERPIRGIPGRAPRPGRRPRGCPFGPRCDWSIGRCRESFPPVEGVGNEHTVCCWRWREVSGQTDEDISRRRNRNVCDHEIRNVTVEVRELGAFYQRREALHNINAKLYEHRCLSLVGESGSGKTTLARCIAGLHTDRILGEIDFLGQPLAKNARSRPRRVRQSIQYIFQSPYASLNPRKTIRQIVAQPLKIFFSLRPAEMEARITRSLEQVDLDESLLNRYPEQLSGGERQRVAIARALAAEPSVLICDEVTSWLDVSVQATIIDLLARLQREMGLSMLFVTHNLALVRSISQEVAVMSEGRIVEFGDVDVVLENPKVDYTKKLLSDTPRI